jgi:DNA repair protein RadC
MALNLPKQSIKLWAEDDRPREKLLLKGKSVLSDAELVAILLRSGNQSQSAVDLAKSILNAVSNNLIELSKCTVKELLSFRGIGEAKALSIIAAMELGRRRRGAKVLEKEKIGNSCDVFEIFYSILEDCKYENFWILLLNRANKIISKAQISDGGVSGTVADPKKIFKISLEQNASSIILCHNHPSGNIKPSDADLKLTKKIRNAGEFLDIHVLDHIIIGEEKYFSFADEGLI